MPEVVIIMMLGSKAHVTIMLAAKQSVGIIWMRYYIT